MVNYRFIKTQQKLQELCEELEKEKVLAIDLECENNLHHYGSYISIIQISNEDKNWVVDVLELKKIEPLKKIFENQSIVKIFHDVSFDLRILKHELNIEPKNLFDTQIAALLIGEKNVGLAALLEKFFSIVKESKFQMADWTIRPINPDMISYAVKDTAFLIKLKNLLEQKLEELGRTSWLKEELGFLEQKSYDYRELGFEDMKGVSKLNGKEKLFAQKLYEEREFLAKKTDKPSYKIISNRKIIELAENPPKTKEESQEIKGIHPAIKGKSFYIYKDVQKTPVKEESREKRERKNYSEEQKQQLQELEDARVKVGKQLGIEPYLIMSKEQVHEIVRRKNYETLRKWQRQLIQKETKLFQ
jgi:ribonuclease D